MASVNVLGLVNQLQNLEQCLTDLLMEMVVKIGSLTDANIFLLVETQEGRKISGQQRFCQQYLLGSLAPVGVDFLFDVDASVSAMRQIGSFNRGIHASVGAMASSTGDSCKANDSIEISDSPLKEASRKRSCENTENMTQPQAKVTRKAWSSDDPEVVFIKTESLIGRQPVAPVLPIAHRAPSAQADNDFFISNDSETPNQCHLNNGNFDFTMKSLTSDNDADLLKIINSKLAAAKIDALKCISGENACSRGTVENRLSTSLCYDFGKTLADVKPFHITDNSEIKSFFNVNFEKWVNQFVNLTPFFQRSVSNGRPEGGQTFTFLGLLRQCARTAFFQRVARNKKT